MTKSGSNIQIFDKLKHSIVVAFQRINVPSERVIDIVNDIKLCFPDVNNNDIIEAIKRGSLGEFGQTYRMSTQAVCIWIREYLKSIKPKGYNTEEILKELEKITKK